MYGYVNERLYVYSKKRKSIFGEIFTVALLSKLWKYEISSSLLCSISPFRNAMRIKHMMHDLFYMQAKIFLLWYEF